MPDETPKLRRSDWSRVPAYRERSARELRAAWRWALRKLGLQQWDTKLFIGKACENVEALGDMSSVQGRTNIYADEEIAVAGLNIANCESDREDLLYVLFHEAGHVLWAQADRAMDPDDKYHFIWEALSCKVARLLWDLYQEERQ